MSNRAARRVGPTAIAGGLDDLLSLGVDDFLIDAAKHVAAAHLAVTSTDMSFECEYIRKGESGNGTWQSGVNRAATAYSTKITLYDIGCNYSLALQELPVSKVTRVGTWGGGDRGKVVCSRLERPSTRPVVATAVAAVRLSRPLATSGIWRA
ncbi:hypothetical protein [Streptomyces mayonensis]|uniref:hypothetical protein n=1 Tax=Streptomyces mayonensis TaxID=2750816 RepID=UPI001C1E22DA|nr:hypothetical protein [Streptomyces sp. A108]MBU6529740.1 hypothetical protein [Streptomyces sp. A108]